MTEKIAETINLRIPYSFEGEPPALKIWWTIPIYFPDFCNYKGKCPVMRKMVTHNHPATSRPPDVCVKLCKYFKKQDVPKIIKEAIK